MSEINNKVNRLLELVKRPQQAKRKPSNFALYWAWMFYNSVALLFDTIAAVTVYGLVNNYLYAALTFAAGFVPLIMHEFLYTRAYASGFQKVLSVIGAGLSMITILGVGIVAGVINVMGSTALNAITLEIGLIITLVIVAGTHGLLAAIYFYVDDGIRVNQIRAESVAYHERRIEDLSRAKEILALAEQGAKDEDEIAAQYGGLGILNEVLSQLRGGTIIPSPLLAPAQDQTDKHVAAKAIQNAPFDESEDAELQPVPFAVGFGKNGNGHK